MLKFTEDNRVLEHERHRAVLVGFTRGEDISHSMEELKGLAEADSVEVIGVAVQALSKPNAATLIGSGKVMEVAETVKNMEADMVIFNDELTGMQLRNLEDSLNVKVIDRTILILDIFAERADSAEGKLQVELAQLKYRMPRLTGFGKALSRTGGGIGTRGPGEKKLETDRRHVERRMNDIKAELKRAKSNRETQRNRMSKSEVPVVALVGYTNSGKSAIMNRILSLTRKEEKSVREKDMLFATLDTRKRNIRLNSNREFILTDTVGFVSRLPHDLIDAFKSTLEEIKYADLILHVVDAGFKESHFQMEVTNRVLDEIGVAGAGRILVFNKMDIAESCFAADGNKKSASVTENMKGFMTTPAPEEKLYISAKTGEGFDKLLDAIECGVFDTVRVKLLIPYSEGNISSYLCEKTNVISMKYEEDGTEFHVELSKTDYCRLRAYRREPCDHTER